MAAEATTELASPSNYRTVCTRQLFRTEQSSPGVAANVTVGVSDLISLLARCGTDPGGPADFDGDGNVGVSELFARLANWGRVRKYTVNGPRGIVTFLSPSTFLQVLKVPWIPVGPLPLPCYLRVENKGLDTPQSRHVNKLTVELCWNLNVRGSKRTQRCMISIRERGASVPTSGVIFSFGVEEQDPHRTSIQLIGLYFAGVFD